MGDNEYSDPNSGNSEQSETNSTVLDGVEIDGERIPVDELKKGYLRQRDYTSKTQKLAEAEKVYNTLSDYASKNGENWQKVVAFMEGRSQDLGTGNGTPKQSDAPQFSAKELEALRGEVRQRDELLGKLILDRDMERINGNEKYGGFFKDDGNRKMLLSLAMGKAGDAGFENLEAVAEEFFDFANSLRAADRLKNKGEPKKTFVPARSGKESAPAKATDKDRRVAMIDFLKQRMED